MQHSSLFDFISICLKFVKFMAARTGTPKEKPTKVSVTHNVVNVPSPDCQSTRQTILNALEMVYSYAGQ